MKVMILAGGFGTRLSEETQVKPKPMVEIGGRPILWHIMKNFAHWGLKDFHIALGYKGEIIKQYFMDYHALSGSLTVDLRTGDVIPENNNCDDWLVHLMDTGIATATGGRIGQLERHLGDEPFVVTYGDGLCNVNINDLIAFHRSCGKIATVTAVRPPARFGGLTFDGDLVSEFIEKPQVGEGWINGGFMVFEPEIFHYVRNEASSLEFDVLEKLASERQLAAYRHEGFWQCMDNIRDLRLLEELWKSDNAPWKVWEDTCKKTMSSGKTERSLSLERAA